MVVGESGEVGNPGRPKEQRKSVVPHLRRSTASLLYPALPGWAIFGAGPPGLDCKHCFPMLVPSLTCHRQVSYSTAGRAKRDDNELGWCAHWDWIAKFRAQQVPPLRFHGRPGQAGMTIHLRAAALAAGGKNYRSLHDTPRGTRGDRSAALGVCDFFNFPCSLWPESSEEHLPTSIAGVLRLRAINPLLCHRSARRFAQRL